MLANTPAGAATKQLLHYGQLIRNKNLVFKQFDYGLPGNLLKYKATQPPEYDLSRVSALTYLMHSSNDLLSVDSVSSLDRLNHTAQIFSPYNMCLLHGHLGSSSSPCFPIRLLPHKK